MEDTRDSENSVLSAQLEDDNDEDNDEDDDSDKLQYIYIPNPPIMNRMQNKINF